MSKRTVIGVVGAGAIARPYFMAIKAWPHLRLKSIASRRGESARAMAVEYGANAQSVAEMLADPEIDIVLNLTPLSVHYETSRAVLKAGKHIYSEKPLAETFEQGAELLRIADARALRVGCAPDTFLGAAHQAARAVIDSGEIGEVIGGSAFVGNRGVGEWHPAPESFYARGSGPFADHAPYYLTQLINLLGPIARVSGLTTQSGGERELGNRNRRGERIPIEAPTFSSALLHFENGANFTVTAAWEMWRHERQPIEVYGKLGSLLNPDPNWSDGVCRVSVRGEPWREVDHAMRPFHRPTMITFMGTNVANYRTSGLADMARAITDNRPHRADGALALHVLEAIDAVHRSSIEGRAVDLKTRCARPPAFDDFTPEMLSYAPFGAELLDSRKMF